MVSNVKNIHFYTHHHNYNLTYMFAYREKLNRKWSVTGHLNGPTFVSSV